MHLAATAMNTAQIGILFILLAVAIHLSTAAEIIVGCTSETTHRKNEDCNAMVSYPDPDMRALSVEDIITKRIEECVEAATGEHGLNLARYVPDHPKRSLRYARATQVDHCETCLEEGCGRAVCACGLVDCFYCTGTGDPSQEACSRRKAEARDNFPLDPDERRLEENMQKIQAFCTADVRLLVHELNSKFNNECLGSHHGVRCEAFVYNV